MKYVIDICTQTLKELFLDRKNMLVPVSSSVIVKGVFSTTELVTLLAIITRTSYMFNFYVVLQIGCVLTTVVTIGALP